MDSLSIVYIVTIVVGITMALLLAYLAKLSGQARLKIQEKNKEDLDVSNIGADGSLEQVVFEEISEVVESKKNCQEVTDRLSNIFSQELEKRINLNSQEIGKKYETIIEEKAQKEEIAWKKYNKVLNEKKDTEAVIRSIAEGLVVVDAKGNVIMINPAAEKLLGTSMKDKVGKPLSENTKKEQLISLVKTSPDAEDREIELISAEDETKKILRASTAVIENESGLTVGMVSVLSDITKQRELDQLKAKFVANVSHELRTPLCIIKNSIALLLNKTAGQISNNQEEFLALAERNIKKLTVLIDDLLDLSKLEAGKMELKRETVPLEKVINESVQSLSVWANTKSIKIEKVTQEAMPDAVIDGGRIGQVLNNLISNAIKFTPNNGTITVKAVFKKDNNGFEISVMDTGIGISKEHLPKVFDRFYQTGERILTDISGTGIGLSIAKEIVELHGGKIWVESEKDQGANFIFTLPLK